MSDLSRLRARWVRLEQRIAKLAQQSADALDDDEIKELDAKRIATEAKLELTITQTREEERRLTADPTAKLRYTGV